MAHADASTPGRGATADRLTRWRFRLELWLWARAVPWLHAPRKDLAEMLRLVTPSGAPRFSGLDTAEIVAAVKRATRRPWLMRKRRCMREGALAFRFLRLAGIPAEIRFGVDRASLADATTMAHCWVTVDGESVINPPTPGMVTVLVHPAAAAPTA